MEQIIFGRSSYEDLGLPTDIWAFFSEGCRPVNLSKGEILYLQGSNAENFYYIVKGTMKTFLTSEDGGERILTVYQTGDILGEAAFFDEQPRVSSAMALSDSTVCSIDRAQAETAFLAHPELAMAMMKYLAATVRLLSSHVDDMAFFRADQRIARLLLSLYEQEGPLLHCTHEFLGHSVGASRVTVSRILSRFQENGMVRLGYRSIELLQPEALRCLSES